MAKPQLEDREYLCRFHPYNEILMRLYEIFETGKKQKIRPDPQGFDPQGLPRFKFLSLGPLA
jgi:hypothetical protein